MKIQLVDGNMRIYRSSDNMYLRTGGTNRVTIASGGDTTFAGDVIINNGDAYNQLLITDATGASSNKQSGIMTLNYAGNNTSIFQTYCTSTGNTIYYGSADGNYRGITDHRFYVNAAVDATTGHTEALHIDGDTSATFAGNVTAATVLNINRAAGSTNDRLTITSADIVTTIERVENTGDASGGYG